MLNPRLLAIVLALLVSTITCVFIWFTEQSTTVIFVGFVSSFFTTGILTFMVLDYFIFEEVNKIYSTLQHLKMKGLAYSSKKKINNDANPLKKLNEELNVYANKKEREITDLKRTEAFRREFLADVSHELKTPIFAAQGFVHTLIDGAINDEKVRDKFLAKAAKSLDGLDALVSDLVALSQMESGVIRMNRVKTDLKLIVEEVVEQLEKKASIKHITLSIVSKIDKPVLANVDHFRMNQVFINLIENAIKYGNEGGIVVITIEEDKFKWKITVKDNGPGIAQEHVGRIFERFYRVEKSRSKDMGGTGLGLAIVKHILAGHRSKITVTSKLEKGTIFTFSLEKAINEPVFQINNVAKN
jgi:two-component system, OmpR family, phosphate regulon sensor histidine kinase PhoR